MPLLTLDQKWHQLFERNGKPIRVQRLEDKIKGLLTKQARANQKYQDLKKKNTLMDNIVLNMKERKKIREIRYRQNDWRRIAADR